MIPGDEDNGLLEFIILESKIYVMTNKGIKSLIFTPACKLLIKNVINLIMKKGRDRYEFTEEEEDCRFWIYIIVKDLEEARKIPKDSTIDIVHTLNCY